MMTPDTRCNGGKHMVSHLMNNHYDALAKVKSTLNTQKKKAKRPHSAAYLKDKQNQGFWINPERTRAQINTECP